MMELVLNDINAPSLKPLITILSGGKLGEECSSRSATRH